VAVGREVLTAKVDDLWLDPTNPRLGRRNTDTPKGQAQLLKLMREWNIEELGTSFVENGFWTQEALVVVDEKHGKQVRHIAVEGNRRLAALKTLKAAVDGSPTSQFWEELAADLDPKSPLFTAVPYYQVDSRNDVDAYLGFRHVTGIKQWDPAEKAEYIARLVDERGMTFDEIRRAIGSKTPTVRLNYIAFRILLEFDEIDTPVPIEMVENRFSVMYLCLREAAVRGFLGISDKASQAGLRRPVPDRKLADLAQFGIWLFGTHDKQPLFTDSRRVSDFARALSNRDSVKYLRTARNVTLDQALRHAGFEKEDLVDSLRSATAEVEQALSRIHLHVDDDDVIEVVERFASSAGELLKKFDYTVAR